MRHLIYKSAVREVISLERTEVRFKLWFSVLIPFQNCISFREHFSNRINNTGRTAAVYYLYCRIARIVPADIQEAARRYKRRKHCIIEKYVGVVEIIDLTDHEIIVAETIKYDPVRYAVNSLCAPA